MECQRLEHDHGRRQAHGEQGEQLVEGNCEREVQAVNQEGTIQ